MGTGSRRRKLAKLLKRANEAFQNKVAIQERRRLKRRNKKKKGQ